MSEPPPSLRRDAARNRQLLLRTAYELMASEGLDVAYEDIARAAGTGMGTMYRRFPQRQDLLDALFSEHIDTVIGFAERAAQYGDAWAGLAWFLEQQLEIEAQSRGLGELLRSRSQATALVQRAHERMTPLVAGLITRAVRAGQLPAGVTPADFAAVHVMVGSVMDASRTFAPNCGAGLSAVTRSSASSSPSRSTKYIHLDAGHPLPNPPRRQPPPGVLGAARAGQRLL